MIVLIGGEKGGTGKTTLATAMAVLHAKTGRDVLLVDTDRQGSATTWAATRDEGNAALRIPCVGMRGKAIPNDLRAMAERFDAVIVDAGGRDSVELRYALTVAERLYIPITPGQFDVWTLETMSDLIEQSLPFNAGLEGRVVLNRASPNPVVGEAAEAGAAAGEYGLGVVGTIIRDRIVHRYAARAGLTAPEYAPTDRKAVAELRGLYREVFGATTERRTNA